MADLSKHTDHVEAPQGAPSEVDLIRIPFHGDEILTIEVNGKPHVALRAAFEAIGLDGDRQVRRVQDQAWSRTAVAAVRHSDGRTRVVITADVRTFLMALATVQASRVADSGVRDKLITYQSEVADVIEQYWTEGGAINPRATDEQLAAIIDRAQRQAEVLRALDGIVDSRWLESKARHLAARALGEEPEEDPNKRPLTVGEYLDEQGVTAAAARKLASRFGKLLKARYVARYGEAPGVSRRFVEGAQRDVAAYTERDRDLFDAVWNNMVESAAA